MIEALASIGPALADPVLTQVGIQLPTIQNQAAAPVRFENILGDGLRAMEAKIDNADALVRQFALDDSVPLHRVTYALEEARLSVELAMQVRARLLESYRDFMNMQL
ncbi:flagellar hook-basal body complex protein FliE [Allosphingosinicella deserti]|uniref:Flagellar hook-basal body complex protein FliE n=1 Tax=Allosphingosinicella deserti TaxID=2116704 RepID=A0A2P7QW59_9SPHN|nr:flagellar hook-basal body complex protein FliE [Sphingomonas deserti]PSJ42208.1 flagellar hook-basal body complex protein FliE [Sphingomonas deserti]